MKKTIFWVCINCISLLNINAQINETNCNFDNLLTLTGEEIPCQILETSATNYLITSAIPPDSSMYTQGMIDASRFYPKKNTGAGGTFCTTLLLSPLFGLVPAILCSSKPPQFSNMGFLNSELVNNSEYMRGYTEQAHKLKKNKVWIAYGAGAASYLALVVIVYAQ